MGRRRRRPRDEAPPATPPSRSDAGRRGEPRRAGLGFLAVFALTLAVFAPVWSHPFVNWDDPQALLRNPELEGPEVVAWAFTTTHMSHYQPLSWLAWAGLRVVFGPSARAHHAVSVVLHALAGGLLFLLAQALVGRADGGSDERPLRLACLAGALAYAVHPLRVEVVAWASAFPYVLALVLLLGSGLAYARHVNAEGRGFGFLALALGAYAASLLARPAALGFPLALLAWDAALGRPRRAALLEKAPFALLAFLAGLAEAGARPFVGLDRIGWGPRVSAAFSAPLDYLGRTLWPVGLQPLDVQALHPRAEWSGLAFGLAFLAGLAALARRFATRYPFTVAAVVSWLALLAPAVGLAPSGLGASADRYTYVPDIALALLAGGVLLAASRALATRGGERDWGRFALWGGTAALLTLLAAASVGQARFWSSSTALWSRALELDPKNDVALYNLALALEEAGDEAGATARLRETVALVPEHDLARARLRSLELRAGERAAAEAAVGGRWEEAVGLYSQVLDRDPSRVRARASRGMALARLGRCEEAARDLRLAVAGGNPEAEIAGALVYCLHAVGRLDEALSAAEAAVDRRPDDARLLQSLRELQAEKRSPGRRPSGAR